MEKEIAFLDTNIVLRLVEGNAEVTRRIDMDYYKRFYLISSLSLIEIIAKIEKGDFYEKEVCKVLHKYNVDIAVKESGLAFFLFKQNVCNNNLVSIKQLIIGEFASTMAIYVSNIVNAVIAHLYYAIEFKDDDFWKLEMEKLSEERELEYIKNLIIESYNGSKKKFVEVFNEYVKSKMIYFLSFDDEMLINQISNIESLKINEFFEKCIKNRNNYRKIAETIPMIPGKNLTKFESIYMDGIVETSLRNFHRFELNDLIDEQNFFFAFISNHFYYTCDNKSINKYKRFFKNSEYVLNFINKNVIILKP